MALTISELDKNFKTETKIEREGLVFYSALSAPFSIHGVLREGNEYNRMPDKIAESVSRAVHRLSKNTAGGRLRFKTSSPFVAIKVRETPIDRFAHMPMTGQCGFDLYTGEGEDSRYRGTFIPPANMTDEYEGIINLPEAGIKSVTINFPLYNGLVDLYVGLMDGSEILPPEPYAVERPVIFYGSSITQGGCASRPGTTYQAHLSRKFNFDYINLGFSGNAKGEDNMADYIASLDSSIFVYDYDHNAPTVADYVRTHERFFLRFREKRPDTPVIFVTRPKPYLISTDVERVKIARATYEGALARGDKNVYFIEGQSLMKLAGDNGTVDGTHPTDLGFFSMAKGMEPTIAEILNAAEK